MNLKNCSKCGKLYNYIGRDLCQECWEEEEAVFNKVRSYIHKNPGCDLLEVNANTAVPAHKILGYLRDGRLTGVNVKGGADLHCLSCGKSINSGKLCEECAASLGKEFSEASKKAQPPNERLSKNSMHSRR